MARIFSVAFAFRGRQYLALVTTGFNHYKIRYTVSIPDEELREILPDGKLSFDSISELKLHDEQPGLRELVASLLPAIEDQALTTAPHRA